MLQLVTLGGLTVRGDDPLLDASRLSKKPLALIAVVACSGKTGVSRDRLQALFWPDSDSDRARGGLKTTMYLVRRALGADPFVPHQAAVALDQTMIVADSALFQRHVTAGELIDAAALYRGPFLDGVYLRDLPEFELWAEGERSRLAVLFARSVERIAAQAAEQHNHAGAADWWRRRAELDRMDGRVARCYAEALVASGDLAAATRYALTHVAFMRAELGEDSDPELIRYVEQLRATHAAVPGPTVSVPAPPPPPAAPAPSASPKVADAEGAEPAAGSASGSVAPSTVAVTRMVGARRYVGMAVAALALMAMAGAIHLRARAKTPVRNVVLVAQFDTPGQDSSVKSIARVATQWVTDAVSRVGLATIDPQLVVGIPRRDTAGGTDDNTAPLPDDLPERIGATLVVTGTVSRRGDSLEFRARLTEWRTKRVVSTVEAIRAPASNPAAGLSELTDRLKGALASFADPRVAELRDAAAPPPRFAAYLDYVEGQDVYVGRHGASDYKGSIPYFLSAARLDTTFDLPLIWLAFAYATVAPSNPSLAGARDSVVDVLAARRHRLSPLSRYALDFFLAIRAGDREREYRAAVAASEIAPGSNWTYMRGTLDICCHIDDAIGAFQQLDVDDSWISSWEGYWVAYTVALRRAGRPDEELAVAKRAVTRTHKVDVLGVLFSALGDRGDTQGVVRLADSAEIAMPESVPMTKFAKFLGEAAMLASASGKKEAAREIAQRCIRWNHMHVPDRVHPADPLEHSRYQYYFTECLVLAERWGEAQQLALRAAKDSDVFGDFAATRLVLLAARTGDSTAMHRYLREAYARPQFAGQSQARVELDATLAALKGDAPGAAALLRRLPKGWAAASLEGLTDFPLRIRRSREVQQVIAAR